MISALVSLFRPGAVAEPGAKATGSNGAFGTGNTGTVEGSSRLGDLFSVLLRGISGAQATQGDAGDAAPSAAAATSEAGVEHETVSQAARNLTDASLALIQRGGGMGTNTLADASMPVRASFTPESSGLEVEAPRATRTGSTGADVVASLKTSAATAANLPTATELPPAANVPIAANVPTAAEVPTAPNMPTAATPGSAAVATATPIDAPTTQPGVASTPQHTAVEAVRPAVDVSGMTAVTNDDDRLELLNGLDPEFRSKLERVIDRMENQFGQRVDLVETHRSAARQAELFAQGRTMPGPVVTWTMDSKHMVGRAADIRLNETWEDPKAYELLQRVAREEGLRTLGPHDQGHIELPEEPIPLLEQIRAASEENRQGYNVGVARVARVASRAGRARVARVARPGSAVFNPAATGTASPTRGVPYRPGAGNADGRPNDPAVSGASGAGTRPAAPQPPRIQTPTITITPDVEGFSPTIEPVITDPGRSGAPQSSGRPTLSADIPARPEPLQTPEHVARAVSAALRDAEISSGSTRSTTGTAAFTTTQHVEEPGAQPRRTTPITNGFDARGGEQAVASHTPDRGRRDTSDRGTEGEPRTPFEVKPLSHGVGTEQAARTFDTGPARPVAPTAPASGAEAVERVQKIMDLKEAQPSSNNIDVRDLDGHGTRLRMNMRGNQLDATLDVQDRATLGRMRDRVNQLQRSLEGHGLEVKNIDLRGAEVRRDGVAAVAQTVTTEAASTQQQDNSSSRQEEQPQNQNRSREDQQSSEQRRSQDPREEQYNPQEDR